MRAILNRQDLSESPTEALTGVSDLKRQIMSHVLRPRLVLKHAVAKSRTRPAYGM